MPQFSRILIVVLLISLLVSACAGGPGIASSWPGLTVRGEVGYLAYANHVYAINLSNGTEVWRFPQKSDAKLSFYAAPVFTEEGHLIIAGYDHSLHSLNPDTGMENQGSWPFQQAQNKFIASPLATPDGIYAPCSDGKLYALDIKGGLRWTFSTEHAQWATPVIGGDVLYLTSMDHRVYALSVKDGALIWKSEDLGGALAGSPTLSPDGVIYVGTFNNELVALDAKTGKVVKRYTTQGWVWSGPALIDNVLYFGDLDGAMYALRAPDLTEIWKAQPDKGADRQIADRPLVHDGKVYFGARSGNLYALDAETGALAWEKPIAIQGSFYASPVALEDTLIIPMVTKDAILMAIDFNGAQKWPPFVPAK